jgi:hypothetical protein
MTRRQQIASMTTGSWPHAGLMQAVDVLADDLTAHGCEVNRAEITAVVFPLYVVSATEAEKDVVRQKLLTWCDWLDALDYDAEIQDAYRRAGPAPV